jgi:hypothetical protein
MEIHIRSIKPNYSNPFPRCNDLIIKLVNRSFPNINKIEHIKPLSGGFSGAVVALVLPSGKGKNEPFIVKIDIVSRIENEIERYNKYLAKKISGEAERVAAKLLYPTGVERITEKGFDGNEYSIIGYSYAGVNRDDS